MRNPRLGYTLAAAAATLWALNGSLARFLLDDGYPSARLAQLRAAATFAVLLVWVLARGRERLRIPRAHILRFAALGVALALNNALYFVAIGDLQIGVALVLQYLAPLWLLLWLRVAHRRQLPRVLYVVAGVCFAGCALVVRAYHPGSISGVGLAAAIGSGIAYATYLFLSERAGHGHRPETTLLYGFGFATLFWLVVQPPWSFPAAELGTLRNASLATYVALLGTLAPFVCMLGAVRHVPAPRAAVVATLEPVLAALLAWPIHHQDLSPAQIAGVAVTVGAIVWLQSRSPAGESERAPAWASG